MRKLWDGEYGLAATFWLWWFVGNSVMTGLTATVPFLGIAGLAWFIVTSVGVWRAGTHYQGASMWRTLSRVCLFALPILGVLIPLVLFGAALLLFLGIAQ